VMTYPDGECYRGSFVKGKYEGKGIYIWPSGKKYEGNFKEGYRSG